MLNVPMNEVCELPEWLDLSLEAPCECPDASPPVEAGHASISSELSVDMPEKPDVVDMPFPLRQVKSVSPSINT